MLLLGVMIGVMALPIWRSILVDVNQEKYGELTYLCASAMRSHDLAKAQLSDNPTNVQVQNLEQTEISLIICQDYDLLQKRLLTWGLRENELGYMRLRAIEASADGLRDVVDAHEIRQ